MAGWDPCTSDEGHDWEYPVTVKNGNNVYEQMAVCKRCGTWG